MKKTLTVNISGTVFHIEEDAYERLQRYLGSIRRQFEGGIGCDEIMADIEARIAELFTERLKDRGEVVTMAEVDHVVAIMGQPEDFAGEGTEEATAARSTQRRFKRLFRDPDDRWIGGVLGGLAAYIGADPLWLRIPFIVLVILGVGSPILVYLILWILVPSASTPAEKLMMEGEPVTVDNLKKAFEEGAQRVAKDVEDLGERMSGKDGASTAERFRRGGRRAADHTARALAVIIGVVLFLVGISLLISVITAGVGGSLFALDGLQDEVGIALPELSSILFPNPSMAPWFFAALLLLVLIPIAGLITGGLSLIIGRKAPRWMGIVLAPLWVVALVVALVIGIRVGNDFQRTEPLVTTSRLAPPTGQVLYLHELSGDLVGNDWRVRYDDGLIDAEFQGLRTSADSIHAGWAELDVRRSPDNDYHLRVERRSQGRSAKAALGRSDRITYRVQQNDSLLWLSRWLSFPKEDKFRAQRVRFVVLVPMGRAVHFGEDLGGMLDDVKNVTNTLDSEMLGLTWTMTPGGLSSSVRPEDVPDDLAPEAPMAPTPAPEAPSATQGAPVDVAYQRHVMPDLLTLLRPMW